MSINRRDLLVASATVALGGLNAEVNASPLLAAARKAAARRAALAATPSTQAVVKPHDVVISRSRHPQAAAHIDAAQRQGQPSVLHIDRGGAS